MDIQRLNALLHEIQIAMLTTIEPDGRLRSRPMAAVDTGEPFNDDLWFFTSQASPKTEEIQEDPRVNVCFSEPKRQHYVSLSGTCELVRDPELARRYWKPLFRAWFPQGVDDPDLALLRVRVEQAEYWDTPSSKVVQIAGLVKALATGERVHPGKHEREKFGQTGS